MQCYTVICSKFKKSGPAVGTYNASLDVLAELRGPLCGEGTGRKEREGGERMEGNDYPLPNKNPGYGSA